LVTAIVAGATTLFVSGLAFVDLAYQSSSLHVSLETAIAVISIVAAHLVHSRFRQSLARSDLFLFYALATFAVTNLLFSALPGALARSYPGGVATWAPAIGALVGAGLLAISARTSATPVTRTSQRNLDRLAAGAIVLAILGATATLVALKLEPEATSTHFSPSQWSFGELQHHPEVILHMLVSVLFFSAGISFTKRAEAGKDQLMTWLAAGSVVAGFARFNYFFFPTLYSNWIYTGDILRLAFYLLLFVGAAREIAGAGYQARSAEVAILEERRRMARDLHDGLAQELAYIVTQTRRLASVTAELATDRREVTYLAAAAERALDESRRAITALTQPIYQPLHIALAQEAGEVADRVGIELELSVDPTIEVDPATRETLLRIVREAVSNAGLHGHAGRISVDLSNGHGLRLRVTDDGEGFDTEDAGSSGFGLTSMQERAKALGGQFRLRSQPGIGTEIEIVLP
jgi:signal transduction histidine kinase